MEEKIKTVAIFMGLFQDEKSFWGFKNTPERQRCHSDRIKDIYQYDRDWNLLMEVVEKIENTKIKDYSISTDITDDKTFISIWHYGDGSKWSILISNYNEEYKDFNKIQRTYKAVIEFINFYNKQKEE